MSINYDEKAVALKALSDPNRLVIVEFLNNGERCACKILEQLKISQPTLSHHMKILCEAELVLGRKDGKWMHYSLKRNKFEELKELLGSFTQPVGNDKCGNCC